MDNYSDQFDNSENNDEKNNNNNDVFENDDDDQQQYQNDKNIIDNEEIENGQQQQQQQYYKNGAQKDDNTDYYGQEDISENQQKKKNNNNNFQNDEKQFQIAQYKNQNNNNNEDTELQNNFQNNQNQNGQQLQSNCQNCTEVKMKIQQQQELNQKLQFQTQKIKSEIDGLNQIIEETNEKMKLEKDSFLSKQENPQEVQLKKELANYNRKYLRIKNQIDSHERDIKNKDGKLIEQATDYLNQLKVLDDELAKLKQTQDILKKNIEQNNSILMQDNTDEQAQYYRKELQILRQELQNLKQQNKDIENQAFLKQEQQVRLKEQIRQIRKQNGIISDNLNSVQSSGLVDQNIDQIARKNHIKRRNEQEKIDKMELEMQDYEQVQDTYLQLIKENKILTKEQDINVKILADQLKEKQDEKNQVQRQLNEKNKEQSLVKNRLEFLKKNMKHSNRLPPMESQSLASLKLKNSNLYSSNNYQSQNIKIRDHINS